MTLSKTVTSKESGTSIEEIAEDLFRISTPVDPEVMPGGFTFNQFLIVDDEPLLFHTGPRGLFPVTRDAVQHVLPLERLRFIAFSHVEADECGSLNDWLREAPSSQPLCSDLATMVSITDLADRPPRSLADGEQVSLGRHRLTWMLTPHLPHGMECGYFYDEHTRTLLCGDLFTQPGHQVPAVSTSETSIWEPSEAFRGSFPYFARAFATPRPSPRSSPRTSPSYSPACTGPRTEETERPCCDGSAKRSPPESTRGLIRYAGCAEPTTNPPRWMSSVSEPATCAFNTHRPEAESRRRGARLNPGPG